MIQKKLRVLLISPLPPPAGGIASWTKQYIEWSQNKGIKIEVVNTAVNGRRAVQITSDRSLFEEIIRTYSIIKALNNKLRKFKPDVVHLNSSCSNFGILRDYICSRIVSNHQTKLIVHYHCNINDQINDNKIQKYILCKLSLLAKKNLVLNHSSKEYIERECQREGKIIANFIDESYLIDTPKFINKKINKITFVGHVQKSKGVMEIFETAKHFSNISFEIAGPISSDIRNIECPPNLKLLGTLENFNVRDLLSSADLFLFPSYSEGFSIALLEAMSMGLPIITTPVGSNIDMIEQSGGVIVGVSSSEEIIEAINKLQNQEIRKGMSNWNVNKVRSKYTTNSVMEEIHSLY